MSSIENNNNFTIKDNSSDIIRVLPSYMIEPLTILARIRGFKSIDDYVIEIIREELEMFTDTRATIEKDFTNYLKRFLPFTTELDKKDKEDLK